MAKSQSLDPPSPVEKRSHACAPRVWASARLQGTYRIRTGGCYYLAEDVEFDATPDVRTVAGRWRTMAHAHMHLQMSAQSLSMRTLRVAVSPRACICDHGASRKPCCGAPSVLPLSVQCCDYWPRFSTSNEDEYPMGTFSLGFFAAITVEVGAIPSASFLDV